MLKFFKNTNEIIYITFISAFCSIIYEFSLAQSLSSILGNSVLRYNLTIGLYVFSLGLGAIFYKKFLKDSLNIKLFKIEFLLSFIGGISSILMLLLAKGIRDTNYTLLVILTHSFIFIVGFLSGFELPTLMDISEQKTKDTSNIILSIDYIGTFVGVITFTFLLLPKLGVFQLTFFTAFLNALICFYIAFKSNNTKYLFTALILVVGYGACLFSGDTLHKFLIESVYLQ